MNSFSAQRRLNNVPAAPRREFDLVARGQSERAQLESFIAERYASAYGARICHFAEQLVGFRNAHGEWAAALGYTCARSARLFAEQYLEASVEERISLQVGSPVRREQIVEVGNLAASGAGAARRVILAMTQLLNEIACTWVVFTSTRLLLNSFARLNIDTIGLAKADPSRLPDGGEQLGPLLRNRSPRNDGQHSAALRALVSAARRHAWHCSALMALLEWIADVASVESGAADGQRWSKGELVRRVEACRAGLSSAVGNGARVGIIAENSPLWIVIDLAAQSAGIDLVPLPGFFSMEQLLHAVRASRLDAMFCPAAGLAASIGFTEERFDAGGLRLFAIRGTDARHCRSLEENEAHKITFTSGTTGNPKGVVLSTREPIGYGARTCRSRCADWYPPAPVRPSARGLAGERCRRLHRADHRGDVHLPAARRNRLDRFERIRSRTLPRRDRALSAGQHHPAPADAAASGGAARACRQPTTPAYAR